MTFLQRSTRTEEHSVKTSLCVIVLSVLPRCEVGALSIILATNEGCDSETPDPNGHVQWRYKVEGARAGVCVCVCARARATS